MTMRSAWFRLSAPLSSWLRATAGRKRVEDHFSWTAIAAQTIALYEKLVAARG